MQHYKAYTDGSFDDGKKVTKWAFIIKDETDETVASASGVIKDPSVTEGRQIGGEIFSVQKAVEWAKENDSIITVIFDYTGVENWVCDLFNPSSKPWAANKSYVQNYRKFISENKQYIKEYQKVKSHSGILGNDEVDSLAGEASDTISTTNAVQYPQRAEKKNDLNTSINPGYEAFKRNLQFDLLTDKQKEFFQSFFEKKNIYLGGEAGTGKSFCINMLARYAKEKKFTICKTAPTGIAAFNIGGSTIHSFFGLGLADKDIKTTINDIKVKKPVVKRIINLKILFIDEISMVSGDLLNKIDLILKYFRPRTDKLPFSGVQIITTGDFMQLLPVFRDNFDKNLELAFESRAWKEANFKTIYLDEIKRQDKNSIFAKLLGEIRAGDLTNIDLLLERINKKPEGLLIEPVKLFAINKDVDSYNYNQLNKLPGKSLSFYARDEGEPRHTESFDKFSPAAKIVELKIGAQIILTANVETEAGFVNGTIGKICGFENNLPIIQSAGLGKKQINLWEWEITEQIVDVNGNITYKKVASRKQLPLKLGWAFSIHKCQGLTLESAEIDLSKCFTENQCYTALSRCKTLDKLYLKPFDPSVIRANQKCLDFYKESQ